jgi:serine/threonine-protein kinase RsbW
MTTLKNSLRIASNLEELTKMDAFLERIFHELSLDHEDQERIRLSLHEAVANAIKHGNKFDMKKQVILNTLHLGTQIEFQIVDEGEGFVYEEIDDPLDPANLLKDSGRGIFLMNSYADEVHYAKNGTHLNLTFML